MGSKSRVRLTQFLSAITDAPRKPRAAVVSILRIQPPIVNIPNSGERWPIGRKNPDKLGAQPDPHLSWGCLATPTQETTALRDFNPAYDRSESIVCITAPQHCCVLHLD
jgi:hypothetical protein